MKITTAAIPWWAGRATRCPLCDTAVELEAGDAELLRDISAQQVTFACPGERQPGVPCGVTLRIHRTLLGALAEMSGHSTWQAT